MLGNSTNLSYTDMIDTYCQWEDLKTSSLSFRIINTRTFYPKNNNDFKVTYGKKKTLVYRILKELTLIYTIPYIMN